MKIPWLIHLKDISGVVLGTSLGQVPTKFQLYASKKTAREPDLIGFDSNKNSHVFEAKGYSSGVNTSELQHAIDQVSQVVAINGVPPSTRTVVYSDLSSSPFLVTIIDPEDNESHGYRIEFKFNSFLRSYYSVFADIEKWTDTLFEAEIGGYSFRVFPIGNSDYFFGIATYVLEQLKDVFHSDTTDSFSILNTVNQEILDDTLSIGYDGTILFNILSKSILHLK
ncbi:MAG: hypothetical protein NTX44_13905 [Ignavibacteriales bacterium]|nr:hypothetical protein [Ignavibacteriales bacterium]